MFALRTYDRDLRPVPMEIDEGKEYEIVFSPNGGESLRIYTGSGRRGVLVALAQMLRDQCDAGYYSLFNPVVWETKILPAKQKKMEEARNQYSKFSTQLRKLYDTLEPMSDAVARENQKLFNEAINCAKALWDAQRVYTAAVVLHDVVSKVERGVFNPDALIEGNISEDYLTAITGPGGQHTYGSFVEDFAFSMIGTSASSDRRVSVPPYRVDPAQGSRYLTGDSWLPDM